jgi:transposase
MGNRRISRDVKIAALNLYEQGHLSIKQILACVGFSRSTFFRVLHLWRTVGDVVRPQNRTGRPRLLHHDDVDHLIQLIHHRPDWFLDELLNLLKHNRFISVHYTMIHRELERAGMSTKKLDEIAEERSEPSRLDYVREISEIPANYIAFLDETSKNDKTPGRRLGRAKKGKRAVKRRKAVRGRRLTATGVLTSRGMLTSTVVEGSMHRDQFLGFLEHQVVSLLYCSVLFSLKTVLQLPLCSPYPGPLSVLVMDNARIHHGEEIIQLCDRFRQ